MRHTLYRIVIQRHIFLCSMLIGVFHVLKQRVPLKK